MAEDKITTDEALRLEALKVANTLFSDARQVNEQKFLDFAQQVFDFIKGPPPVTTKPKSGAQKEE